MFNVKRICNHSFISNWLDNSSIIVDCGLNQGEFSKAIANLFGCKIYGLEPVPYLLKNLQIIPNLIAENAAVSYKDCDVTLYISSKCCASLFQRKKEAQLIHVPGTKFESFVKRNKITDISLLKVDIEGAEIYLFDTTSDKNLKNIEQISIEFHDFLYKEMKVDVQRIHERMKKLGFFRINFSRDNTDVLYINRYIHPLSFFDISVLVISKYVKGFIRSLKRIFVY